MDIPSPEKTALLKYFPKGIVALDLETTGLSPLMDEIIELSAVKLTPDGIETFDQLIHPGIHIPAHTIEIHGIKDQDVENSPKVEQVLPQFLKFSEGLPLLAHNAKFDIGFLVFSMHQNKLEIPSHSIFCSIKASRSAFRDFKSHKLAQLAKLLEIPLENHHRALDDAYASLMVMAKTLLGRSEKSLKKTLQEAKIFNMQDFEKNKEMQVPEKLLPIQKKIQSQTVLDIKYRGGTHKGSFRPIRPVSFLPMPEGNVLYAQCLLTNIYKSFAVKKITDVKELNALEIKERLLNLEKVETP